MDLQHEAAAALLHQHARDLVRARMGGGEGQHQVEELVLLVALAEDGVLVLLEVFRHAVAGEVDVGASCAVVARGAGVAGLHHGHGRQQVVVGHREDRRGPRAGQDAPHTARLEAVAGHRVLELLARAVAVLVRAEHAVAGVACNAAAIVGPIGRHRAGVVDGRVAGVGGNDQRVLVDLIVGREVTFFRAQEVGQAQRGVAAVRRRAGARVVDLLALHVRGDGGQAALEALDEEVERDNDVRVAAELVRFGPQAFAGRPRIEVLAHVRVGRVDAVGRQVDLHVDARHTAADGFRIGDDEFGVRRIAPRIERAERNAFDLDVGHGFAGVRRQHHHDMLQVAVLAAGEHRHHCAADRCGLTVDDGVRRIGSDDRGGALLDVRDVFSELAGCRSLGLLLGLHVAVGACHDGERCRDDHAANGNRRRGRAHRGTDRTQNRNWVRHSGSADPQQRAKNKSETNQTRHVATPAVSGKNTSRSAAGAAMCPPVQIPKL